MTMKPFLRPFSPTLSLNRRTRRQGLDCGSPLPLFNRSAMAKESGRGLPQSKTLARSFALLAALLLAVSLPLANAAGKPKNLLVVPITTVSRHSSIETAERILDKLGRESGDFTVEYARVTPPREPSK